jgi:hypothetical protein
MRQIAWGEEKVKEAESKVLWQWYISPIRWKLMKHDKSEDIADLMNYGEHHFDRTNSFGSIGCSYTAFFIIKWSAALLCPRASRLLQVVLLVMKLFLSDMRTIGFLHGAFFLDLGAGMIFSARPGPFMQQLPILYFM